MRRHDRPCILFLSMLAILIGCQTLNLGQAATQQEEPRTPRIEPLPEAAGSASEAEAGAREGDAAPQETASAAQEPPPPPPRTVEKPTTSIPEGGCVTTDCHPGIKAHAIKHGPVSSDTCEACHEEADPTQHTFTFSEEDEELCASCHDLELDQKYVHSPAAEGQCAECHDPHGGQDQYLLRDGWGAAICNECHDDVTEDMPAVHGPVAAGACSACHRAHSSDNAALLTQTGRDLCLDCHITLKRRLDTVRTVHGPVATECTVCHSPHASEHAMMLQAETVELCLDCHSQIEDLIDEATTGHDAVTTGPACRNCHSPHGSDSPALLINDMVDVCLSCHDREVDLDDGTHLMDLKAVRVADMSLHGPIAQGSCAGACHEVHGGSNHRLLVAEYPPEFYAPFEEERYALCFSCHNAELVRDERTDRLTNFRNGDHNMHFVHVNKDPKGRTCRACHETHASKKAKHVRESVPFGASGWELPIKFEKTKTGGRCSPGCHRPYGYDRANPVSNLTPEGSATLDATVAPRSAGRDEQRGSRS